jgi:hypothetical protein
MSSIVGVWELVSDTHEGLMIDTGSYHMFLISEKNRAPFDDASSPTESEASAAFRSVIAGAGIFSLSGTAATYEAKLGLTPNGLGQTYTGEFIVDGDHLVENLPSGVTHEWRRVG